MTAMASHRNACSPVKMSAGSRLGPMLWHDDFVSCQSHEEAHGDRASWMCSSRPCRANQLSGPCTLLQWADHIIAHCLWLTWISWWNAEQKKLRPRYMLAKATWPGLLINSLRVILLQRCSSHTMEYTRRCHGEFVCHEYMFYFLTSLLQYEGVWQFDNVIPQKCLMFKVMFVGLCLGMKLPLFVYFCSNHDYELLKVKNYRRRHY